jgi:hypothetical protein
MSDDDYDLSKISQFDELECQVANVEAQIDLLNKRFAALSVAPTSGEDFDHHSADLETAASEIRKRDNCSRTEALSKARRENPVAFARYRAEPEAGSGLVSKSSVSTDAFMAAVQHEISEARCSALQAMQTVRKRHPDLYEAFQDG